MLWSGQAQDIPEALGTVADATKHSFHKHYAMVPGNEAVRWFFYVPISGIRKRLIRRDPCFATGNIDAAENAIRAGQTAPAPELPQPAGAPAITDELDEPFDAPPSGRRGPGRPRKNP